MTDESNGPAADAVADARAAEEYFITEMILCTLTGPFVSPRIGGRRVMEPILSVFAPDAPRVIHFMCGEGVTVSCDERDVQYIDGRQILTRQEVKILRWAEKNLPQSGRDIYVSMIALRVMIGAVSPDIRTYCCIRNGDLVLPALPVRMRLMPSLGVVWPDVPAWRDIVKSLVTATGRPNLNREMERLLVHVLVDLGGAIGPAIFNTNRECSGGRDRDNEVGDRVEGIAATVPEADWKLFDGRQGGGGGGGRIAGGGGGGTSRGRDWQEKQSGSKGAQAEGKSVEAEMGVTRSKLKGLRRRRDGCLGSAEGRGNGGRRSRPCTPRSQRPLQPSSIPRFVPQRKKAATEPPLRMT